jgi:hypothetical protein
VALTQLNCFCFMGLSATAAIPVVIAYTLHELLRYSGRHSEVTVVNKHGCAVTCVCGGPVLHITEIAIKEFAVGFSTAAL